MKAVLATPKNGGETVLYSCDGFVFGPSHNEEETAALIAKDLGDEYECVTYEVQSYSV